MATRDYKILLPRDTMVRSVCEEVRCESWQFGWETICDESTDLGLAQATYIRQRSGRTFTEHQSAAAVSATWRPGAGTLVRPLTVFRFEARQRCFAEHRTRPARFLVTGGGTRSHVRLGDWLGDLDEHVGRLADGAARG